MMLGKKLVLLAVISVMTGSQALGQRSGDPRSYYREFSSESRRIAMKNLRYMQTLLKGEDPRRVNRYAEMVSEQLEDSKRNLERVGPYEDDRVLYDEFIEALEMYTKSFEGTIPDSLKENYMASFENLTAYYKALEEAEGLALEAAYKMEEAEKYFAKKYEVRRIPNERTEKALAKVDNVVIHERDATRAYVRVRAKVDELLKVLEEGDLETKQAKCPGLLSELRNNIATSLKEAKELMQFEEDDLAKEVLSYIEDIDDEMEDELSPLVRQLTNEFLDPDDYEDAQEDLEDFIEWHNSLKEDFQEEKEEFIVDYLEDD